MRDNRCICLQGTLPGAPFTPQPDCLLHGHRHPSRMPHAPAAEPPELAAIRERVERDFVTDPASVSGVLSAELMQARIDRRALLVNFDAELSEHAKAAPEMPRPPAEEAPTEYMVVVPSICGDPTDYQMSYRTDRVRKPNRDAAIEHGLDAEGHDDFLIALVVGDTLTGLAWMTEDRDDAEEIAEAAEALGLAAPEPANGTAQERAGDTGTSGTGSGRGTDVAEASGTAQVGDDE